MRRLYLAYSEDEFWRQAVAKMADGRSGNEFLEQAMPELAVQPGSDENWPQTVASSPADAAHQFLQRFVAEVPWGHHLVILNKLADPAARLYYLRATAQCGWSRSVLLNQIKAQAYERAVTRAKHEVLVFSGLRGDQIDLTRTRARGVRDLKYFLDYAERGPRALIAATGSPSTAEPDSEFECMVAERIRAAGYDVHHQVACSGYRIDLAVVDTTAPGRYLLGVECDGATYHRAATARDRDKLRQAVLEDLGWTLHRIWSTDWWHDANGQMEKLLAELTLLVDARVLENQKEMEEQAAIETLDRDRGQSTLPDASVEGVYRMTDFSGFQEAIDPDRFYDSSYDTTLSALVVHVLEAEAPILDSLLVQRIARAHQFQRTGRLIGERVMEIVARSHHLRPDPVGGDFVWLTEEMPTHWSQYRRPSSEEHFRKIEEIAYEEIRAALLTKPTGDIPIELARIFGIRRLAAAGRERLEAAVKIWEASSEGAERSG